MFQSMRLNKRMMSLDGMRVQLQLFRAMRELTAPLASKMLMLLFLLLYISTFFRFPIKNLLSYLRCCNLKQYETSTFKFVEDKIDRYHLKYC